MSKILFIICSPTTNFPRGSISTLLGKKFIEIYKLSNPKDEIIELDLNNDLVGQVALNSKNINTFFTDKISEKNIQLLKNVDKVVISSPMTNYNFPAVLKNYFDRILIEDKTFKYDKKNDPIGLLNNLKVQIITTQGAKFGWYLWGNHTNGLVGIWNMMGAYIVEPITIFGTNTPEFINLNASEIVDKYIPKIEYAAKNF